MKIKYVLEFTQNKKVEDEIYKKGIFDNVKRFELDTLEDALKSFIKFQNDGNKLNVPILWSRLWVELRDENNKVLIDEDCICNLPYIEADRLVLKENERLESIFKENEWLLNMDKTQKEQIRDWLDKSKRKVG